MQNVSFCRQIFFCVCFIDFFLREILQFSVVYPTKSLNPILKLFFSLDLLLTHQYDLHVASQKEGLTCLVTI